MCQTTSRHGMMESMQDSPQGTPKVDGHGVNADRGVQVAGAITLHVHSDIAKHPLVCIVCQHLELEPCIDRRRISVPSDAGNTHASLEAGCCSAIAGVHLTDICTAVLACSSAEVCNWYRLLLSKQLLDGASIGGQGPLRSILLTFAEIIQKLSIAQKAE